MFHLQRFLIKYEERFLQKQNLLLQYRSYVNRGHLDKAKLSKIWNTTNASSRNCNREEVSLALSQLDPDNFRLCPLVDYFNFCGHPQKSNQSKLELRRLPNVIQPKLPLTCIICRRASL